MGGVRLSVRKKKKKKKGREGVIRVGCCGVGLGWPWAGWLGCLPHFFSSSFFFFLFGFLKSFVSFAF
jgi:hypothetical protein